MPATANRCFILLFLPFFLHTGALGADWYRQGLESVRQQLLTARNSAANAEARAKNIILFIGDGMGMSTVTAARILDGQNQGRPGEEGLLYFETFPHLALAKTYNTDRQTSDSAGTMSAIMTGHKTRSGVLAVNEQVVRGDCSTLAGNELITALELAEIAGMATGIVTNTRLTHATPAATYAHSVERGHEHDALRGLRESALCTDIARQLIEFPQRFQAMHPGVNGLEVALGGGRRYFLDKAKDRDPENGKPGKRGDGRNLIQEWLQHYPNAKYVWNSDQLAKVDSNQTQHLLGLFQPSHMRYESERDKDTAGEPDLATMTRKAIEILSRDPDGYFLMVEGGRIDHAHHQMDPANALRETLAFDKAIRLAHELSDPDETLIIVTADHSHTMTIGGYPKRGNPILGKIDGDKRPTLAYTTRQTRRGPRETHAGEDVGIYATGPGSALINGTLEQQVIFHVMNQAGRLEQRARAQGWPGR